MSFTSPFSQAFTSAFDVITTINLISGDTLIFVDATGVIKGEGSLIGGASITITAGGTLSNIGLMSGSATIFINVPGRTARTITFRDGVFTEFNSLTGLFNDSITLEGLAQSEEMEK